jgi:hypothetical protein
MTMTKIVAAVVSAAAMGSVALGGIALASDEGGSGTGGTATNNCLNVGVDLLAGIGVAGQGLASGASCLASANGTGGNAS